MQKVDTTFIEFMKHCILAGRCVSSLVNWLVLRVVCDNKQLLYEVEHDIMNYQNRGLCYLPKPKG